MSDDWFDLEPASKPVAQQAPVRFGYAKAGKGTMRGRVLIRAAVLAPLDMKSWRVDVKIGGGARLGRLAIVPNPAGKFELTEMGIAKGGGTYRLMLPPVASWSDEPFETAEQAYSIETIHGRTKGLVVHLPLIVVDPARALQARAARHG